MPGSNPRTLVEMVDARVRSAALQQDLVAIARPGFGKRGLNDGAAMSPAAVFGMGYDVFDKSVSASTAQKVGSGYEHAGCCDPFVGLGDKEGQSVAGQHLRQNAFRTFDRFRAGTHFRHPKEVKQALKVRHSGQSRDWHVGIRSDDSSQGSYADGTGVKVALSCPWPGNGGSKNFAAPRCDAASRPR